MLTACGGDGGDDDSDGDEITSDDAGEVQDSAAATGSDGAPSPTGRYDLPSDHPLPTPEGGTMLSALFDETSATSNVTIDHPFDALDGLIATYDTFFDAVAGETVRVPLTDGLSSWQNDDAGYSVVVDGQNADVQVRLQTGIRAIRSANTTGRTHRSDTGLRLWSDPIAVPHDQVVRRWPVLIGAVVVMVALLVWVVRAFGANSVGFALALVWLPMTWVGMASRRVQIRLPERYHSLRRFERSGRVYELIGVRVVKAVLRRGPLAVFNPDLHLPAERTPEQLEHLAQRMRDAEASHALLFVLTLGVVVHAAARGWWAAAVSTLVFDVLLNGYPVILQRYNRVKLAERFDLRTV